MDSKKYHSADLNRFRVLFFNIGLAISLGLTYLAFEWRFYDDAVVMKPDMAAADAFEEMLEVPPTEQPPPPPPVLQNMTIIAIDDPAELEDQLEISFDIEMTEDMVSEPLPEDFVLENEPEEEEADEIFVIVEEKPMPVGGMEAFYTYINRTITYPSSARRMHIEGRVFVQFVIEKDGRLSQVEVIRGIHPACDREAVRVIKNAPAWKPGKQRGRPVRVKMVLPINFKIE